eukprot:CAMPEP_0178915402 /NCGR_PEP_ID=MMETSP0786-20121207/12008_1 /TAXON_ID=186022 /ORGANISM="Thalassionema frauenfeldii, Strain CCMP 1798" /LENGTH=523 /DNA_ID=CAMNT_0020588511 /DNA_START=143 /DNA_END=1717 /DNA_ORIENTATION=+
MAQFEDLHESIFQVCETTESYDYDSGMVASANTTIYIPDTPWMQLDFSESQLAPGATIILTTADGTRQELSEASLELLNGVSAVLETEEVSVELIPPPQTTGQRRSRVVISELKYGLCGNDEIIAESLCGADDRTSSDDVRAGRIGGCTGYLVSNNVFIQAGHCGTPSSSTRLHFTFTGSSAPIQDQYAVDVSTYQFLNNGVGQDWGAGLLLPNSETGKLPGVAQSEKCGTADCGWYTIGSIPTTGDIRITGYGTKSGSTRSQRTHVDALTLAASTYLRYIPDTMGGNSGSPVIHEQTGEVVGVHTHGGCENGGNHGTRIDRSDFQQHVQYLLGLSGPTPAPVPTFAPTPTPPTFAPTANPTHFPTASPTNLPTPAPVPTPPTPLSGTNPAATPNNGICEDGETCYNSNDCRSRTGGKPSNRYCCYGGDDRNDVTNGVSCADSRCGGSQSCSTATEPVYWTCGDGVCAGGGETNTNCPQDCPLDTPAPTPFPTFQSTCKGYNAACQRNTDCCSNKCRGNRRCG